MFKKLLVASAVFAASTSVVFAGGHHNYKADYKGEACPVYQYLAGPYVGFSVGKRVNYTGNPTVYSGLEGILSLGYAGMINPMFYLAGEIFVGNSIQLKNFPSNYGAGGVRTTWNYGLDIIPGIMITDYVLMYARAGVVWARFNNQNVTKTGWQVGVGGQTNIYQNWDLRGEYVYSQYGRITAIGRPLTDQFNLGVVYKFL